ncbi:MAG: prepilin-type N-terminal cleavage/methylation domain-containing protein [Phycisphaeraceae bacterium]
MNARRGFTLLEMMAVVVLVGVLATATAMSLADQSQRATRADALDRLIDADRGARLAAKRLGPSTLRIDLDDQRLWVVTPDAASEAARPGHSMQMPAGFRITQITWLAPPTDARRSGQARKRVAHRHGVVELPIASNGITRTYAMQIEGPPGEDADGRGEDKQSTWLVVCGMTGQTQLYDERRTVDNLFEALASARPDAD